MLAVCHAGAVLWVYYCRNCLTELKIFWISSTSLNRLTSHHSVPALLTSSLAFMHLNIWRYVWNIVCH